MTTRDTSPDNSPDDIPRDSALPDVDDFDLASLSAKLSDAIDRVTTPEPDNASDRLEPIDDLIDLPYSAGLGLITGLDALRHALANPGPLRSVIREASDTPPASSESREEGEEK